MTVEIIHDHLGYRLAEDGTRAHRTELEDLAEAVEGFAPGAAAALVDWTGSEIARLRAYAVARSALREHVIDRYAEVQRAALSRGAFRLTA